MSTSLREYTTIFDNGVEIHSSEATCPSCRTPRLVRIRYSLTVTVSIGMPEHKLACGSAHPILRLQRVRSQFSYCRPGQAHHVGES
jgi:hypothetical protein